MEPTKLDRELRKRLMRFLHLGKEEPKYFPGNWRSHNYYDISNLKSIELALQNGSNNTEVVNIILKAHKQGWCTRFETIAFALTKCLIHGSPAIKEATYLAASEICVSPEQLLTFNHFTRLFKTGNGRGWCKHVKQWYTNKEPMELAKEITRVKSRHCRSHKTLLRKSHMKVAENDRARSAVIKYALFGLKQAKQLVNDAEGTEEVFDYIQKVEDFRHCEDPKAAAAMAAQNSFTLDHVPGHLLTSKKVWNAILPQLPLEKLLYNIQRLHNMGFLTADSTTTAIVVSLLTDKKVIRKSRVTPLAVYIELVNYQKKSRPLKNKKAKIAMDKTVRRRQRQVLNNETGEWQWNVAMRHPKEAKTWGLEKLPNPSIIEAMYKLMDRTWLLTPPTNARYLITLDMRNHMFKGRHFCKTSTVPKKLKKAETKTSPDGSSGESCGSSGSGGGGGDADTVKVVSKKRLLAECFFNRNVTPGHAAIILALQLLKREKNVKLAVFTDAGIELVKIEPKFSTINETETILREANLGVVQLDAPIEWARKNNRKFDVFINMVDRTSRFMELDLQDRGGRGLGARYGPPPSSPEPAPGHGTAQPALADHCPARALQRYRQQHVRNAKMIVMSLASHRVMTTDGSHDGILDIIGVDEHVPKVMDAFALGQFE